MNCKTLPVHLDDSAHRAVRLDYALELPLRHDAASWAPCSSRCPCSC